VAINATISATAQEIIILNLLQKYLFFTNYQKSMPVRVPHGRGILRITIMADYCLKFPRCQAQRKAIKINLA
jgi:hypothetical protein